MQTVSNANQSRLVANPISELDKADRRRGAALLLEVLRSEGVQYVFGNPGTTDLPFIDALVDFQTFIISGRFKKRALSRWPMVTHKPRAAQDSSIFTRRVDLATASVACGMPGCPAHRWS